MMSLSPVVTFSAVKNNATQTTIKPSPKPSPDEKIARQVERLCEIARERLLRLKPGDNPDNARQFRKTAERLDRFISTSSHRLDWECPVSLQIANNILEFMRFAHKRINRITKNGTENMPLYRRVVTKVGSLAISIDQSRASEIAQISHNTAIRKNELARKLPYLIDAMHYHFNQAYNRLCRKERSIRLYKEAG